jgi:hypothetical protein
MKTTKKKKEFQSRQSTVLFREAIRIEKQTQASRSVVAYNSQYGRIDRASRSRKHYPFDFRYRINNR